MQEEFKVIESFQRYWPAWPKGQVFEIPGSRFKHSFCFAREVSQFQVFGSLVVGKRGGVWECLTVVDPTKKFLIDQLVMHSTDDDQGFLFPLHDIRDEICSSEDRDAVCLRYVTELIGSAAANPDEFLVKIKTVVVPDGPRNSIPCSQIVPGCYGSRQ